MKIFLGFLLILILLPCLVVISPLVLIYFIYKETLSALVKIASLFKRRKKQKEPVNYKDFYKDYFEKASYPEPKLKKTVG